MSVPTTHLFVISGQLEFVLTLPLPFPFRAFHFLFKSSVGNSEMNAELMPGMTQPTAPNVGKFSS